MTTYLNPQAQAEEELRGYLLQKLREIVPEMRGFIAFTKAQEELIEFVKELIHKTVERERFFIEPHPQCGADNPEGKAAKCLCYCHKGHFRHFWQPVIKTPVLNPDGTYHLIDRCKYCPDMRLKIIRSKWVNERHEIVSLEYLIRGEYRVLTKEEWQSREPKKMAPELMREVKGEDENR